MSFAFVSGDPSLDLAATVLSRRGSPVDLRWLDECAALPSGIAVDPDGFAAARSLREALYRLALDRVLGRQFDSRALEIVTDTAATPPLTARLTGTGVRRSGDLRAALSEVARGGIALLADPHATLKECGRPGCTRIYLDRSRGARRRWCGMAECGNRVKAAAYRARRRATSGRQS